MAKYDEDSDEIIEEKSKTTKRTREEFKKEIAEDQSEQITEEYAKKYFYECKKFPKDFLQTKADESNSNKIIIVFASEGGSCDHPLFLAVQKIWRKPVDKYEKYFKHEQISSLGDIQPVDVDKRAGMKTTVVTGICLVNNKLDKNAFISCCEKISFWGNLNIKKKSTIHLPMARSLFSGFSLFEYFQIIETHFLRKKLECFSYSDEKLDFSKSKPAVKKQEFAPPQGSPNISPPPSKKKKLETPPPSPQKPASAIAVVSSADGKQNQSKNTQKIFAGVNAVLDGFSNAEKVKLVTLIENAGGRVSEKWSVTAPKTSHLICAEPSGSVYDKVDKLGGVIVRKEWVSDSCDANRRLNEIKYEFNEDGDNLSDMDCALPFEMAPLVIQSSQPSKPDNSPEQESTGSTGTLCPIFTNLEILLDTKNTKEPKLLYRYCTAYDCKNIITNVSRFSKTVSFVVSDSWSDVCSEALKKNSSTKIVNSLWVWDSINTKCLLPYQKYLLKKK